MIVTLRKQHLANVHPVRVIPGLSPVIVNVVDAFDFSGIFARLARGVWFTALLAFISGMDMGEEVLERAWCMSHSQDVARGVTTLSAEKIGRGVNPAVVDLGLRPRDYLLPPQMCRSRSSSVQKHEREWCRLLNGSSTLRRHPCQLHRFNFSLPLLLCHLLPPQHPLFSNFPW